MSTSEFYSDNFIANLALLLMIDASRIKIASVSGFTYTLPQTSRRLSDNTEKEEGDVENIRENKNINGGEEGKEGDRMFTVRDESGNNVYKTKIPPFKSHHSKFGDSNPFTAAAHHSSSHHGMALEATSVATEVTFSITPSTASMSDASGNAAQVQDLTAVVATLGNAIIRYNIDF